MDRTLEQLVYVSVATEPQTFSLLNTIRRESARRNEEADITGLLVAGGGRFVQALEGEPVFLDQLMSRIAADTRHDSVQIIDRTQIAERQFSEWSMAAQLVCEPVEGQFQSLLKPFGSRIGQRRIVERFARLQAPIVSMHLPRSPNQRGNLRAHTRVPQDNG